MTSYVEVRPGAYHDSVSLMQVSNTVAANEGVQAALVAMATQLNLELFAGMDFTLPDDTGPNDMVVAIRADDDAGLARARQTLDAALENVGNSAAGSGTPGAEVEPRTLGSAANRFDASLAFVSVPGEYAFVEAMDALEAGLSMIVFSDNVPLDQEIRLKDEAASRDLLVMGPDCGTAVVGGTGFGFANVTRPGPVGIVGASGTGSQELMSLLDAAGTGISHCLGVGGRDLSAEVAGRSTRQAMAALEGDPATELIVVVSKPPAPEVAKDVRAFAEGLTTPVRFALLGPDEPDLSEAAAGIVAAAEDIEGKQGEQPQWPHWPAPQPQRARAGALRGLFCGGTLCEEAMAIASPALGPVFSNIALRPEWELGDGMQAPSDSAGHVMIDFGDDRFTQGRPHPMIDPGPRLERFAAEAADPGTGVLLLDVVLGYGAHPDPAADLAAAIRDLRERRNDVPVIVSLAGTAGDPQGLRRQATTLSDAGADVFLSNAHAARYAVELLTEEHEDQTRSSPA